MKLSTIILTIAVFLLSLKAMFDGLTYKDWIILSIVCFIHYRNINSDDSLI